MADFQAINRMSFYTQKFQQMRQCSTEIIGHMEALPWEHLVNKELLYLKFVLQFLLSLTCVFGHDMEAQTEEPHNVSPFAVTLLDIKVKIAFHLERTESAPRVTPKHNFASIQSGAQQIVNLISVILDRWPLEMIPLEPQQRQVVKDLLYKTLQTRCAIVHSYVDGKALRECAEKYARVVKILNEVHKHP